MAEIKQRNTSPTTTRSRKPNASAIEKREGQTRVIKSGVDRPFLIIVLILVAIGTIMVFSASYAYAKERFEDSYYFAVKQIRWVICGMGAMFLFAYVIDHRFIRKIQIPFFYASMLGMLLVLFLGTEANEAVRWFQIGPFSVQPSEFAKLAIILYFSELISSGKNAGKSTWRQLAPYLIVGGYMAVTLFFEPHLSCLVIVALLILLLMYFGDVPMKQVGILAVIGVVGIVILFLVSDHARARLLVWWNPEEHLQTGGWQPVQSLLAIGSGGFWGVGLGQSTQKHLYLPEPQNDYIFAILCEELGFIFATFVILLFIALIWRGIYIAKHTPDIYSSLVVIGIISQVGIQALLNIGVVTNTLPSTGISLPFFSYGGTSLITLMAEMGIVLNISRYSYVEKG
ncbi:MAG: putative lipid II flippase FtsW [Ruminococcaceae bacterium]|nr:putative lipid II flippase FtsW [Oscillospiraceae bacterium]